MSDTTPAGWQPDPTGRHDHRYWDGSTWTDNVADAGMAGTDALAAAESSTGTDPTTTIPVSVADTTAAWSTTPGAPVPPTAQPPSGAGGGGRDSKKGLLIGAGILAAVLVVVIAAFAMGGDDDTPSVDASNPLPTTSTTEIDPGDDFMTGGSLPEGFGEITPEFLATNLGISQEQAECLSEKVTDAINSGELDETEAFTAMGSLFDYLDECDISLEEIGVN